VTFNPPFLQCLKMNINISSLPFGLLIYKQNNQNIFKYCFYKIKKLNDAGMAEPGNALAWRASALTGLWVRIPIALQ